MMLRPAASAGPLTGLTVGLCTVGAWHPGSAGTPGRYDVTCACGSQFRRAAGNIRAGGERYSCSGCRRHAPRHTSHIVRAENEAYIRGPKPCGVCSDLPHRRDGIRCSGCMRRFENEATVTAVDMMAEHRGQGRVFPGGGI